MRTYSAMIGIVWGAVALFGSFALAFGDGPGKAPTGPQMFALVIALWGPPILIGLWLYRLHKEDEALHDEVLKAAGVAVSSKLYFLCETSGIAINRDARTITLLQGGLYHTYPFSDVRGYRTYFQPLPNSRRGSEAQSGLFMTVNCTRRSDWKIDMLYQAQQEHWMHLLNLELAEPMAA